MKDTITTQVWFCSASDLAALKDGKTPQYVTSSFDMKSAGWMKVCDVEVTIERPNIGAIVPQVVATLREQQRQVNVKAAEHNALLEQQINNMLALEFTQ